MRWAEVAEFACRKIRIMNPFRDKYLNLCVALLSSIEQKSASKILELVEIFEPTDLEKAGDAYWQQAHIFQNDEASVDSFNVSAQSVIAAISILGLEGTVCVPNTLFEEDEDFFASIEALETMKSWPYVDTLEAILTTSD